MKDETTLTILNCCWWAALVATVLLFVAGLCSCGLTAPESWQDTANPLDQPATYTLRGPAMGRFGPGWADPYNATR